MCGEFRGKCGVERQYDVKVAWLGLLHMYVNCSLSHHNRKPILMSAKQKEVRLSVWMFTVLLNGCFLS